MNNELTVGAPVEKAWETMLNLERVAPCLPGASIDKARGDGEYEGSMRVKIGPVIANYKGTVKIEEADEEARRVVLRATGRDARGQGTASATIVSTLNEDDGGKTKINVETDMDLTGRAAQFGRGIAQDVATRMLDQFADRLESEMVNGKPKDGATSPAAAPQAEDSSKLAPRTTPQKASEATGSPEQDPNSLDLGALGREAILKRAVPAVAAVAGVALTFALTRSLRRPPSFQLVVRNFEVRRR